MKKNVRLLVCVLALGALLAGCETPTNADKDKWSPVTSLSQLDGTWKFSYSETRTLEEWVEDFKDISGEELPLEAQILLSMMMGMMSSVKVTMTVDGILTIDADERTVESSGTTTTKFSGNGSNGVYLLLKQQLGEYDIPDVQSVQFNDSEQSMTMTYDFGPGPVGDDDNIANVLATIEIATIEINQKGDKIRISGPDSREIIAVKQ